MTPRPQSLNEWIDAIGRLSVHDMDFGLERVGRVWRRLHSGRPRARVVTIAGTNGKGTCAHFVDRSLRARGLRTGLYTSPHLLRFNERIRIDGHPIDDAELCRAFSRVEHARRTEPLTFFEFTTLAALAAFARRPLDVLILEVGLGGRLDAVNVIDPDVAVVTRIGLDHMDYLGDTLDAIGREKAGIFRRGVPAVVCREDAPPSVARSAQSVGAKLVQRGAAFRVSESADGFDWSMARTVRRDLPRPHDGPLDSFVGGLAAMTLLNVCPSDAKLRQVLENWSLAGRGQWVDGQPHYLLDVAHNPQAGALLAERLAASGKRARFVVGMLRSKDSAGFFSALMPHAASWHAVPTTGPRGLDAQALGERLRAAGVDRVTSSASVAGAMARERARATDQDVIVVCGSFQVVGPALAWLGLYSNAVTQRPSG